MHGELTQEEIDFLLSCESEHVAPLEVYEFLPLLPDSADFKESMLLVEAIRFSYECEGFKTVKAESRRVLQAMSPHIFTKYVITLQLDIECDKTYLLRRIPYMNEKEFDKFEDVWLNDYCESNGLSACEFRKLYFDIFGGR